MPNQNKPNWPTPAKVREHTPGLDIALLTRDQKKLLWHHLKAEHPEKAKEIEIIMKDPAVIRLMSDFEASLIIEQEFIPRILIDLVK